MSKLSELVNIALKNDSSVHAHVSFGNIFNSIAQKINAETGVDCKGCEVIITAYDITHIMKRHGNEKEEKERGQVGVNEKDLELIREIVFNYDIVKRGNDMRNTMSLLFVKRIGVEFSIIAKIEGRLPNKKMVVKTMLRSHEKSRHQRCRLKFVS